MEKIRVLIAEDSAPFRQGLRDLLRSVDDLEVVGEATTGEETVQRANQLQPDVILMDLRMPGIHGIEATRQITYTSPHVSILILTMFEDDESVFSAIRAGARGYLLKGALKVEIVRAIRGVASGEAIFGATIARRLMQYFSAPRPAAYAQAFPELSERERQVLELMAQHYTNVEIAKQLSLAPKTVRNHVSNIFAKLQVADRAQAIIRARDAGFGKSQA